MPKPANQIRRKSLSVLLLSKDSADRFCSIADTVKKSPVEKKQINMKMPVLLYPLRCLDSQIADRIEQVKTIRFNFFFKKGMHARTGKLIAPPRNEKNAMVFP